ncbi:MAG: hypothetical protein AB1546_09240, partial [bacterium]
MMRAAYFHRCSSAILKWQVQDRRTHLKFLFKVFGCATVFTFFTAVTVYMLVTSSPYAVRVKKDVAEFIYPVARENVKIKFENLIRHLIGATELKTDFVLTELEANAYLHQYFPSSREMPIVNPYLFFRNDIVRFRFEISFDSIRIYLINRLKGANIDENFKEMMEAREISLRLTVTTDIGVNWTKEKPYLYLSGLRIGLLPLPVKLIFGEYTDEMNKKVFKDFNEEFKKSPFLIQGVEVKDGMLVAHLETKLTDRVILEERQRRYLEQDTPIARSLRRHKCRFGCTEEEQKSIDGFIKKAMLEGEEYYSQ